MKLRQIVSIALLYSFAIFSAAAADESREGAHLLVLDPDFPSEVVNVPGLRVHPVDEEVPTELLPSASQSRLLREADLGTVLEWDSFERDRFFLRVENQGAAEVANRYAGQAEINSAKISRLRALIGAARKSKNAAGAR